MTRRISTRRRFRGASRRNDRGAALVELTLAMPVLAIFVLGMFSAGGALNGEVRMSAAVHDSARYASRLDPNAYTSYGEGSWAANVASLATQRDTTLSSGTLCVAAVKGTGAGTVTAYTAATGPGVGGTYSNTGGAPCWQPTDPTTVVSGRIYVQVAATRVAEIDYFFGRQSVTIESHVMMQAEWDQN